MTYTLGPIRPDERHERIFVRRRGRRLLLLVIVAVVMLGSAGGLWALYHVMTEAPAPGEVPMIRADDQPTRKRPDQPGGMAIPDRDSLMLNHTDSKVEQLLPGPESPLPRPAPTEPAPVAAAEPPAAPAPAELAPPPPPAAAPTPAPPSGVAAAPATAPAPPPAAPPAAAKPAVASAPSGEGKGYRLQIGAVRSAEAATQEWERLKKREPELLGPLGFSTQRVDLGERGIFYRLQAGPVADAAKAEHDCSELKKRGVGCILVKP